MSAPRDLNKVKSGFLPYPVPTGARHDLWCDRHCAGCKGPCSASYRVIYVADPPENHPSDKTLPPGFVRD